MRVVTKADAGQWIKATNQYERIMSKAATLAMRDVGKEALRGGRAAIASAGFTPRFQRSLRALNKPPSGYVLNPAVYIHSTINYSDVFETGKTISGNPFLWLPLPNVPPYKDREHMTPSQYVRIVGPLVTMRRPGKLPMLGGAVETGVRPTRGRLRRVTLRRAFGERLRQTVTVPLFVGVPSITIAKKFDVKAAAEEAFGHLDEFYTNHLEIYEGRR